MTKTRFNEPRFSLGGEERIRRAIERGHRGDDPHLPIRKVSIRRDGDHFISWFGPLDHGCPEHGEALWEMEIDLDAFREGRERVAAKAGKA